jgi:hypothetical protein
VAGQPAKTVKLFDGKDLSAWTHVLSDEKAKFGDVWSIADGVLICKGKPVGYLRTKEDFRDYVLTLEWRFPEGSDGGNSGVLVHTSTPNEIGIWPKSLEVQLHKGNAGDFWVIGHTIEVPDAENRQKGRRFLNLTDDSEKPIGQWNKMEITCAGDEITVKVNGTLVNQGKKASATAGAICLQSEGAEIHFRNIELTPVK